jgi:hypothetical protein
MFVVVVMLLVCYVVKHFFYNPPVLVVWQHTTSQTGAFATACINHMYLMEGNIMAWLIPLHSAFVGLGFDSQGNIILKNPLDLH